MPDCTGTQSLVHENFSNNSNDVITQAIDSAINDVENDSSITTKGKNRAITKYLFDNGVFELKETTTQVSERLGITRQAVYKYLREFKSE
jgi:predicted transcriptional regulator YheO